MQTLLAGGIEIALSEEGAGPPVLLLHCSSASHREWAPLAARLAPSHRVYRPDLVGYGRSGRWPAGAPFDHRADVRVVEAVLQQVREPVHVIAHSYGAAVALEAALDQPARIASLGLVEPVSFHLLDPGSDERALVTRLARRIHDAVACGAHRRAARLFMSFWVGPIAWALMPRRSKRNVTASMSKVALEFEALERLPARWDAIAALDVPTRLVLGAKTRAPARRVTEGLCQRLPRADLQLLRGAGHMSPFTHEPEVSELLIAHLRAAPAGSRGRSQAPVVT